MEFNWKQNIPDLAAIQQRNAEARRQAAQAAEDSVMNGPNAWMVKPFEQNAQAEAQAEEQAKAQQEAWDSQSNAYKQVIANQAAQEAQKQADMQRIQELQNKIAERKKAVMDDPRMQIAAMLAMGGQPSALSSMLVSSVQGDIQAKQKAADAYEKANKEMEALENGLNKDLMMLAEMDDTRRAAVLEVSLPLFRQKFRELQSLGARSMMGGLEAWENKFKKFKLLGDAKRGNANRKHNRDSKLRFK